MEPGVLSARIFAGHVVRGRMSGQFVPLLDEHGQVTQLAVFHNEVDVCFRLEAIMEGNDVRMTQRLEYLYLAIEVILQLSI